MGYLCTAYRSTTLVELPEHQVLLSRVATRVERESTWNSRYYRVERGHYSTVLVLVL